MKWAITVVLALCSAAVSLAGEFVPPSKPDYAELDTMTPSPLSKDPTFIKACQEMAGYYMDPNRNPKLSKTLIMAGVNNGYKDFFHNFKCFADRLGLKFLPVSFDEGIFSYFGANNVTSVLMGDIPGRAKVGAEPSGFGGKNFNLIGCRKMEAVGAALQLGYDVVFTDVDIALLHDPIDHLFLPGIDYVHSTNKGCNARWKFNETMEGNTGFYSVQSNPRTIRTWDLTYRACARAPLYDDQTMFWLVLRTNTNPSPYPLAACPSSNSKSAAAAAAAARPNGADANVVVSCPLDDCQFSASHLRDHGALQVLIHGLRSRKPRDNKSKGAAGGGKSAVSPQTLGGTIPSSAAVMVHANWMNGKDKKKAALASNGLWIARRFDVSEPQKPNRPGAAAGAALARRPEKGKWSCTNPSGPLIYV